MTTIKQHKLAVAICLACGLNSAQAAISNGMATNQPGGSGQAGELFLNVWDQAASTSYALDLGTLVTSIYANQDTDHVWHLDQTFTDWAAQTSNPLTFNVAGNNSYVGKNDVNDSFILSSRTGYTNTYNVNMNGLIQLGNKLAARAISLNVAVTPNDPVGQADYAGNFSAVTTNPNDAAYFDNTFWGINEGIPSYVGSATVRNGTTADQTLDLVYIHSPGGAVSISTKAIVEQLNGYLTLDISAATLTYVAAVPVPSAVWLFLGGLLSILKFKRRNFFPTAA